MAVHIITLGVLYIYIKNERNITMKKKILPLRLVLALSMIAACLCMSGCTATHYTQIKNDKEAVAELEDKLIKKGKYEAAAEIVTQECSEDYFHFDKEHNSFFRIYDMFQTDPTLIDSSIWPKLYKRSVRGSGYSDEGRLLLEEQYAALQQFQKVMSSFDSNAKNLFKLILDSEEVYGYSDGDMQSVLDTCGGDPQGKALLYLSGFDGVAFNGIAFSLMGALPSSLLPESNDQVTYFIHVSREFVEVGVYTGSFGSARQEKVTAQVIDCKTGEVIYSDYVMGSAPPSSIPSTQIGATGDAPSNEQLSSLLSNAVAHCR